MHHCVTATLTGLVLGAAGAAQAGTVIPKYDLTGVWKGSDGTNAAYFQEGTMLTSVAISEGFAHSYPARYINPSVIRGIQTRVNRINGCVTEMLLTVVAVDADHFSVSGKALDSHCDLVKGQIYTSTSTRTQ